MPVHVASAIERPLAGCSRHARAVLRYPDPLREETAFIEWMRGVLQRDEHAYVIPVTERTLVALLRHRDAIDLQRIAMAPPEALEQVLDKDRTGQLAQALGIPLPRSLTVDSHADLQAATAQLGGFPVVVKPARSVGKDGAHGVQLAVSYAHTAPELAALVSQALRYGSVILQEYFRGDGIGIELIADQGQVQYAFQHRRLHEVPLTGGGSSLRISESVRPELLAASRGLMKALAWHGVAMVEFKRAPDSGEFRLVEINGRFWGSLPLAVAAGADFPWLLHGLMTTGRIPTLRPARDGVICRQLARDIDWLEHVFRKAAPPQLVRLPSARDVLHDSLLVFSPRHHFDVQSLRDPWPGLVDLGRIVRRQSGRVAAAWKGRRRLRHELARARAEGGSRIAGARHVLFLCYGNINRSALAHAYASGRHGGRLQFASAGFHAPAGRPADPVMVEVAATCGVDLAPWQSNTLSAPMVAQADVILAMEVAHLDRLAQEHPHARGKAFLLGARSDGQRLPGEVPDPYGGPRPLYDKVCHQVMASVDSWFSQPS